VQLLAWQTVDGADGAPECIEEAVTWIMARMRRRQLVARAWAVHEFLAELYTAAEHSFPDMGCQREREVRARELVQALPDHREPV
jgi:hypothetical protein